MQDKPQPHELSTITFFPGDADSGITWADCILVSMNGSILTFLDAEERLNIINGGCFRIMQQGQLPEASPIVAPGKPQLSIIGGR